MDGKLSRSCVLANVLNVPRGPLVLRLGENGGFGGRYSSVQMWGQQLTPDVIYGIYQMGPIQTKHNIFTDLASFLNISVRFTGPTPGAQQTQNNGFFDTIMGETCSGSATLNQGRADLRGLWDSTSADLGDAASELSAMAQRF